MRHIGTFSRGIARVAHVESVLQAKLCVLGRWPLLRPPPLSAVVGWGNKPNTVRAQRYALAHGLPYYRLEDGFLRSFDLGVHGAPPLSLIVDGSGIYYDASSPSDLEQLILRSDFTEAEQAQGRQGQAQICAYRLSKYNKYSDRLPEALMQADRTRPQVLVIDQTWGDCSISGAMADAATFEHMLHTARQEHPGACIWIKTHPDVLAGRKRGHLTLAQDANIHIISEAVNPLLLLAQMDTVYTVSSQMGFEALLLGKSVVTFGVSWYAGWGLTDDRHPYAATLRQNGRRVTRSLAQLFTAAYVQYCRYLNPQDGRPATLLETIAYVHKQCSDYRLLNRNLVAYGFSWWKRLTFAPFFASLGVTVRHCRSEAQLQAWASQQPFTLLLWGMKYPQLAMWASGQGLAVMRVEDGFLRSAGLGSNLTPPLSLCFDDEGIYFNPQQPSRLERLLNQQVFDEDELQTADAVIRHLLIHKLSKYNVGSDQGLPPAPDGKRRILVPGQVEDDASIRYGAGEIASNLALLQAVRAACPDAWIVYKPHPDVVSGNRCGSVAEHDVLKHADVLVDQVNISVCIAAVDEVHTITSLAGFEALLQQKRVVCYGQPFYAGWGLTEDCAGAPARRQRQLTVRELVAAALLHYPVYVHPQTRQTLAVEDALVWLQTAKRSDQIVTRSWVAKKIIQLRFLLRLWRQQ